MIELDPRTHALLEEVRGLGRTHIRPMGLEADRTGAPPPAEHEFYLLCARRGGIVSRLIGELSFGTGSAHNDHAKVAILAGSLTAALLAAVVLRARNRRYRLGQAEEQRDDDGDGVPDVFNRA